MSTKFTEYKGLDLPTVASGLIFNCDGLGQTDDITSLTGLHSGNAYIVNDDLTFQAANYENGELLKGKVKEIHYNIKENAYFDLDKDGKITD